MSAHCNFIGKQLRAFAQCVLGEFTLLVSSQGRLPCMCLVNLCGGKHHRENSIFSPLLLGTPEPEHKPGRSAEGRWVHITSNVRIKTASILFERLKLRIYLMGHGVYGESLSAGA